MLTISFQYVLTINKYYVHVKQNLSHTHSNTHSVSFLFLYIYINLTNVKSKHTLNVKTLTLISAFESSFVYSLIHLYRLYFSLAILAIYIILHHIQTFSYFYIFFSHRNKLMFKILLKKNRKKKKQRKKPKYTRFIFEC